jgi:hypothetical protein
MIKSLGTLFIFSLISVLALVNYVNTQEIITSSDNLIKGITLVAPPKPIDSVAFMKLKNIGTEWVALIPYAFTNPKDGKVVWGDQQWWGERLEGIETCIRLAHRYDMKVMLKPQVWSPYVWIGDLDFDDYESWQNWETAYSKYLMSFVELATKYNVEMFCIGTEINHSTDERPLFWKNLIENIRKSYRGKLTYSANWDHYDKISFWKELDFVGISSYFPLDDAKTPDINTLQKKWKPICKELHKFSRKVNKPILFTEYGYLAIDGCAGKTWEIEPKRKSIPMNDQAQANAFEALWSSMSKQNYWAGGFMWKWFPEGLGHEGVPTKDYSPQGKAGEKILEKWFKKRP